MGLITIEVPQDLSRSFRFSSEESAKEVLTKLEQLIKNEIKIDEDEDMLGLWADGKESSRNSGSERARAVGESLLNF